MFDRVYVWQDHSRTLRVVSVASRRSLPCWKVNLNLNAVEQISIEDHAVVHSANPQPWPVSQSPGKKNTLTAWCFHRCVSLLGRYWAGVCAQISPEITFRIEPKQGFHVLCTEGRLPSSHWTAMKPRSVEGCSDGCSGRTLSHHYTGSLDLRGTKFTNISKILFSLLSL